MNTGETTQVIHFHPYPISKRLLVFSYQKKHKIINTDNDKILFPDRYSEFLIEATMELCLRNYEDSNKSQAALIQMMKQYDWQSRTVTETILRMQPSGDVRSSIQRGFSAGGVRIDYGQAFDNAWVFNLP